ncbi:YwaF family protein [Aureispira anguillae]|uniref:TIGR02206 family membrane protein n=1 Tax=Aureispira anguillae TaxID=2864201 RepID=A0A915YBM7_9BACT|nr:TIGR02206 family membrane protein [Aureispira anguillae]BDS10048.1 TIGR02206 family membrane protein [Aureispira anguillae]
MINAFFRDNHNFSFGNSHHIAALVLFSFFTICSIYIANKYCSEQQKYKLGNYIGGSLSLTIVLWIIAEISLGKFDLAIDLPLYLCSFMAFTMPIFTLTRSFLIYEIIVFWIWGGTLQAVITPDLYHNFPHYNFIKYWMGHAGLIWMILYATYVYQYRPTFKSIFKSFGVLQIYFILIIGVNYLLGSNYAYLNEKPTVGSVLDWFGPWPYYVIQGQFLILPIFFVIYMPFYFSNKRHTP